MLRLIIIISVLYLIYRLLARYILPYLAKRYVENTKQRFYREQNARQKRSDGEINVDYVPPSSGKINSDGVGEYIDFEEEKDNS
mgnify:CR=1 FL=1